MDNNPNTPKTSDDTQNYVNVNDLDKEYSNDSYFNIDQNNDKPKTNNLLVKQGAVLQKWQQIQQFLLKKWWLTLLVVSAVGIIFVTIFAFFNLQKGPLVDNKYENINLRLLGPSELSKGSPEVWRVIIENKEKTPLQNVVVELNFDRNFEFIKSITPSSDNKEGTKYSFSRLDGVGEGIDKQKIEIQGATKANTNESIVMSGKISYTPDTLVKAQNQGKLAKGIETRRTLLLPDIKTITTNSTIAGEFRARDDIIQNNGEEEITLKYRNTGNKDIRDLRVRINYPENFKYASSEFKKDSFSPTQNSPDNGNNLWNINNFPAFGEHTLSVKGIVEGTSGQTIKFTAEIEIRNGSEWQPLYKIDREISIASKPLVIKAEINGKNGNQLFNPGETVTITVNYSNQGVNIVRNVNLSATIDDPSDLLDWNTVQFAGGGRGSISDRTVRWISNNIPELASLQVKASGQVSFSVKVKEGNEFLKTYRNQQDYNITPKAFASGQNIQEISYTGDTYRATGDISFTQKSKFVSVDPLNQNLKRYNITWELRNVQNKVNNITIKTRSPLNALAWQPSSITPLNRINQLTYNSSTGDIIWKLESLAPYSGISNPVAILSFDLVTQSPQDLTLIENVTMTGYDDLTGQKYEKSASPISSGR
jgi:hypothetical protein